MKCYSYIINCLIAFSISLCITNKAIAIERTPRICDREIIESLAELKQGQKNFEKRFDDVNNRFNDVNNRINSLENTMLSLFGAIIALVIALFCYIAWDRRTAMKPMQKRLERIELDLRMDLDLQHKDGSRLTRLIKALQELAKTDKKVAEVLKSFSLM